MINYSFIIPHKNVPSLLKRCVDSIPQRDDIEIIIVDDNSSPDIVNFNVFPCSDYHNVKVVQTKEGLGAGFARNKGIDIAQGKWLVFADSDDYFITENLSTMMDCYSDCGADIVFFNIECLYSNSLTSAPNADKQYKQYIENKNAEILCRYQLKVPWGKFIKKSLVVSNGIRFDETKVANDIIFSLKTGICASYIKVDQVPIYVWLVRNGSLTSSRDKEAALIHFDAAVRYNEIVSKASLDNYRKNLFFSVPNLHRAKISYWDIFKMIYLKTPSRYLLLDLMNVFISYIRK